MKEWDRITNREYQELTGISKRTATRDLDELLEKGVFERLGARGTIDYFLKLARLFS